MGKWNTKTWYQTNWWRSNFHCEHITKLALQPSALCQCNSFSCWWRANTQNKPWPSSTLHGEIWTLSAIFQYSKTEISKISQILIIWWQVIISTIFIIMGIYLKKKIQKWKFIDWLNSWRALTTNLLKTAKQLTNRWWIEWSHYGEQYPSLPI